MMDQFTAHMPTDDSPETAKLWRDLEAKVEKLARAMLAARLAEHPAYAS